MIDLSIIQIGDILLYQPLKDNLKNAIIGSIITTLSYGGKYSHASIYSGGGSIIESHINTGVVEKPLSQKWFEIIDVYRYKYNLNEDQQRILIEYIRNNELGKGYDLAAFPSSFAKATLAQIFGWKNFSKCRSLLNDDSHRFCSELVAVSYWNALHIEICPGIDPKSVQPANLGRSKSLYQIS